MSKSKGYPATNVNEVWIEELAQVAAGRAASVGMDIGKHEIFSVVRWENGEFEVARLMELSSVTLLSALAHYGGPAALAADPVAAARLAAYREK